MRRRVRLLVLIGLILLAVLLTPTVWLWAGAAGHVDTRTSAPVAIVFGAQLAPGGKEPMPFLRGRLNTAAELIKSGRATAVLVSGDSSGASGDETAVMSRYLVDHGIPARRIVADNAGLDTYDTCKRAHDVFGVRRALLVSQAFHLHRAVTLCRDLGIDADGVAARCDGCQKVTLVYNRAREIPAAWKAVYDRVSGRPPAVSSPADPALTQALHN
jgi:vancomycin permeability regulator SanA